MVDPTAAIHQRGVHRGKEIVFGYDRMIAGEVDGYEAALAAFGPVTVAIAEPLHYLSSARLVAERVQGRADRVGVLVCGTGIGMAIAANKLPGIYAARCVTVADAEAARTINNANVVCLAAGTGVERNAEILDAFMTTAYEGRKQAQLATIVELFET